MAILGALWLGVYQTTVYKGEFAAAFLSLDLHRSMLFIPLSDLGDCRGNQRHALTHTWHGDRRGPDGACPANSS